MPWSPLRQTLVTWPGTCFRCSTAPCWWHTTCVLTTAFSSTNTPVWKLPCASKRCAPCACRASSTRSTAAMDWTPSCCATGSPPWRATVPWEMWTWSWRGWASPRRNWVQTRSPRVRKSCCKAALRCHRYWKRRSPTFPKPPGCTCFLARGRCPCTSVKASSCAAG